ncbi:MAG: hypothetical protein ACEPO2_01875 [Pelagibaca sp.]
MTDPLDQALLDAHARSDIRSLIRLYHEAAKTAQDEQATGFFLTHAYVFALEAGDDRAADLKDALVRLGRDIPAPPDL